MCGVNNPHRSIWWWCELGLLLLGLGVFVALACTIAQTRLLWYDEIFTRQVLAQGSWSRIVAGLRRGLDLQPPAFFLVTSWTSPLGEEEVGLRLPAILGFAFSGLCLYIIARRWLSQSYAVGAMMAPWILWFNPLGVEARPYGLEWGFAGLALLGWTYRDRKPLAGRTAYLAGIMGAALVHYYGFLVAVPFGVAAAWTAVRSRRLDLWTVAGCVCAVLPDMWNYPLIRAGMAFYKEGAWNAPSGSELLLSPYGGALAVLAVVLLANLRLKSSWKFNAKELPPEGLPGLPPSGENLACWAGFCAIPIAGLVLAMTVSGMIAARYVSMYSLGYGLLLAYLLARISAGSRWPGYAAAGAAAIAFLTIAKVQQQTAEAERTGVLSNCSNFEEILDRPSYRKSHLLIGDWADAMQLDFYCPALQQRIVFPGDPERSLKYLGNDTAHKGLLHLRGSFPLDIEPLDAFVHQEQNQLLVYHSSKSFLKEYFTDEPGFAGRLHLLQEGRGFALYAVDPSPATGAARREMP